MFHNVTNYIKNCPQYQTEQEHYTDPKTKQGLITANNPMDILCVDFSNVDPLKDGQTPLPNSARHL